MTVKRGKFGGGELRRLQYRQFSREQLALIWAASAIFILLVFLLADGNPVNWLQGVVTAIAGATALLAITVNERLTAVWVAADTRCGAEGCVVA